MIYNETTRIVNSSTNALTFVAPYLPDDGVFRDTVFVTVTAMNIFGVGPTSDPETTKINGIANCYVDV